MKKAWVMVLTLMVMLAACDNSTPSETKLTCQDDPKGRSKAEQTMIADACFRSGGFRKSSGQEW